MGDLSQIDCEQLCLRIRKGDRSAETELCNFYHKGLVALLWKKFRNNVLCEDVSQETLLIVLKTLRNGGLKNTAALGRYISQTATYQGYIFLGKQGRVSLTTDEQLQRMQESDQDSPDEFAHKKLLSKLVKEIMEEMGQKRDKEVLVRYYLYAQCSREICESLGISQKHFHRVISRARKRMKEKLKSRGLKFSWMLYSGIISSSLVVLIL